MAGNAISGADGFQMKLLSDHGERAQNPRQLVEMFSDDIWQYVLARLNRREDVEDVVMEVFSVAIREFHKVSRADDQRRWLLGIARRQVASAIRSRYRHPESRLEEAEGMAKPTADGEEVRLALAELTPDHAEALILKYVNGLSMLEVSAVMRKSLPATNSLLQRARGALREALGPSFFGKGGTSEL
jgi:RNA polymerase sigma-70 factor (ECF subfamily)